jgi:stage II sporulation protein M
MRKKIKKRKKKTKLKKEGLAGKYKDIWNFIKESKNFIYTIIGIFVVTLVIGFIFPGFFAEVFQKLIQDLLEKTKNLGFSEMFGFIVYNNIKTSFMGLIFGLLFGIFPLFLAALNGYLLGFVANIIYNEDGIRSFWKILPHGVFELPAFFISLAIGAKLGYTLFLKTKDFKRTIKLSLETFIFLVIPLLLIAGFIETCLIFLLK